MCPEQIEKKEYIKLIKQGWKIIKEKFIFGSHNGIIVNYRKVKLKKADKIRVVILIEE